MGMFKNSTKETKEFEKVILEIEKERDTISWADTTIQSCLWNLENPKADRFTIDWCVRDLRESLNKKEKSNVILQYLKYTKLRHEMFKLYMVGTPDTFLEDLDRLKEKNGINNLWKEEQYKEWREEVKKHPEKVGKLHITEDSFTFDFSNKKN
tara:strand:+ start:65 stop:523 length:459 start_codon:yes stop_codon:yes gene_type:complete